MEAQEKKSFLVDWSFKDYVIYQKLFKKKMLCNTVSEVRQWQLPGILHLVLFLLWATAKPTINYAAEGSKKRTTRGFNGGWNFVEFYIPFNDSSLF